MDNKKLSKLIDKARDDIEVRNVENSEERSISYRFGSSNNFGMGDDYWTKDRRKVKTFRFLHDLLK